MGAAHGAEVRHLGGLGGEGLVVERARGLAVQGEGELLLVAGSGERAIVK